MSTMRRARAARTAPMMGSTDTDSVATMGLSTLKSVPAPARKERSMSTTSKETRLDRHYGHSTLNSVPATAWNER
jgi:hypothetical protein